MHSKHALSARFAILIASAVLLASITAPAAWAGSGSSSKSTSATEYELVYKTAHKKLGKKWKHKARGPKRFDCSGLVWYAFKQHDLNTRIGGYRSVAGYFTWFKKRGLVSKKDPQVGDLVVWGRNKHIGIYIGDGKAISTLTTRRGVSIHPVKDYLGKKFKFKAYLHVDMTRPEVTPPP